MAGYRLRDARALCLAWRHLGARHGYFPPGVGRGAAYLWLQAARFLLFDHYHPDASLDLVYCNGVFHHIPPQDRAAAVAYVAHTLRPGGLWAFWENNPWNPGRGMSCVASPLIAMRDRSLQRKPSGCCGGDFEIVRIDFQFIFPRM